MNSLPKRNQKTNYNVIFHLAFRTFHVLIATWQIGNDDVYQHNVIKIVTDESNEIRSNGINKVNYANLYDMSQNHVEAMLQCIRSIQACPQYHRGSANDETLIEVLKSNEFVISALKVQAGKFKISRLLNSKLSNIFVKVTPKGILLQKEMFDSIDSLPNKLMPTSSLSLKLQTEAKAAKKPTEISKPMP